jgi:DNA-binding transcriptional ArsR family regulator
MIQPTPTDALFNALGDGTRRAILEQLRGGPLPVVEIARRLPVGRPAISQHLKVLKKAGLVTAHPEGTRRRYQIDPSGIGVLREWLDGVWNQALEAYKAAVEQDDERLA